MLKSGADTHLSACCLSHRWNHPAGADAAAEAHPPLVVRILPPPHEVLVAHEVGSLVDHEAAALHPDGVTAAEVRVKVRAVVAALIAPTHEVLVLVKDNLAERCQSVKFFSAKNRAESPVRTQKTQQLSMSREDKQHSPYPWSPLERFPMFSGLFILPLHKQSIVIQILS